MEIIAHRGSSLVAPENTLAAFDRAWSVGADACELDVRWSRDGWLFVLHDEDLWRTCGVPGRAEEFDWAALEGLDAGAWKGASWRAEPIPLLDEVVRRLPAGRQLYIEVKSGPEIVPALLSFLTRCGRPAEDLPLLFLAPEVLEAALNADGGWPCYAGFERASSGEGYSERVVHKWIAYAVGLGARGLSLEYGAELSPALVDAIHEAGLRLLVWTVNDPAIARRCREMGVDGLITDTPETMGDIG